MRISRTPLRVSLFGGGTDYIQWTREHDGAVLGGSINHYAYVVIHDGQSQCFFDLPNKSGLGSSSAYTVGLLRACTEFDKTTIARMATTLELEKMDNNVGFQDQWLCALGGFRHIKFTSQDIRDTVMDTEIVKPLQDNLMLFNTHHYRRASDLVKYLVAEMKEHTDILSRIADMPKQGVEALKAGRVDIIGPMLDEAWQLKKQQSKYITTPDIDAIYEAAIKAGATGGKLLGGGGGGFIIFFCEISKQESVRKALSELTYTPFKFETAGTELIYHD